MNPAEDPTGRITGYSLQAFGGAFILLALIEMFFLDAFTFDVMTLIVIGLGISVSKGSRRAAKWALAIMIYYVVLAIALAVVAAVSPANLNFGGRPAPSSALPLIIGFVAVAGAWALLNVFLLIRRLRTSPA